MLCVKMKSQSFKRASRCLLWHILVDTNLIKKCCNSFSSDNLLTLLELQGSHKTSKEYLQSSATSSINAFAYTKTLIFKLFILIIYDISRGNGRKSLLWLAMAITIFPYESNIVHK